MQYACIAATKRGARCRNFVQEQGAYCSLHQRLKEKGKVILAPPPDVILLRVKTNPNWTSKLRGEGIRIQPLKWIEKEKRHVAHAQRYRREAYRFRHIADSGVPVFGREGLSQVSIQELWEELSDLGYCVVDVHLTRSIKKPQVMNVLVIVLERVLEREKGIQQFPAEVLSLLDACWGKCHIWANPPDEQGKVVHTVNLSHRQPHALPEMIIEFANGLWRIAS